VVLLAGVFSLPPTFAGESRSFGNDSHAPRVTAGGATNFIPGRLLEPKNVPDFADSVPASTGSHSGSALKAGLQSTTLPPETRLRLVVEYAIDAKTSQPGDVFEAHVRDDLYLGQTLLLPRGSLVRGRVSEVNKPRLISRAGKIGLHLEQIVTPTGETVPLDAALEFQKGTTNQRGELDPGTNFATRVGDDVKSVTGLKSKGAARGALMAANIATLGAPAVATMIGGSAVALFRSGDNMSLAPGQELEILLTNDLGLQLN
jgi:hypothetical protein